MYIIYLYINYIYYCTSNSFSLVATETSGALREIVASQVLLTRPCVRVTFLIHSDAERG